MTNIDTMKLFLVWFVTIANVIFPQTAVKIYIVCSMTGLEHFINRLRNKCISLTSFIYKYEILTEQPQYHHIYNN